MTLGLGVFLFVLASAWLFWRLYFVRKILETETHAAKEVREASHELSNEATKFKQTARRISESTDPYAALIDALGGGRYERPRK